MPLTVGVLKETLAGETRVALTPEVTGKLQKLGGYSALRNERSSIGVNSIIATRGTSQGLAHVRDQYVPPLNNRTLFKRDANLCLYCGLRFPTRDLTRYDGGIGKALDSVPGGRLHREQQCAIGKHAFCIGELDPRIILVEHL